MQRKISTSKASWVNHGNIDDDFLEWGAKQERRVSTELLKPPSIAVPYLPWVKGDDDLLNKMRQRRIIASDPEPNPSEPLIYTGVVPD